MGSDRRDGAPAPADLATPALRTFFRIADSWELTGEEQMTLLGSPPRSTFYKWKAEGPKTATRDLLERLSYVLAIYRDLEAMYEDPDDADDWLRTPRGASPLNGRSVLDWMLAGSVADLYEARRFVGARARLE